MCYQGDDKILIAFVACVAFVAGLLLRKEARSVRRCGREMGC
jgi:hypothetical protein